jgi:hypothetical protein
MASTDVIAYAYDADNHCIYCTRKLYGAKGEVECNTDYGSTETLPNGDTIQLDENGVRSNAHDTEGNEVHPIFETDDNDGLYCGSCHDTIREPYLELEDSPDDDDESTDTFCAGSDDRKHDLYDDPGVYQKPGKRCAQCGYWIPKHEA